MKKTTHPLCALLAKDSEWVDILQSSETENSRTTANVSDEEEVLQLVNIFFNITFHAFFPWGQAEITKRYLQHYLQ